MYPEPEACMVLLDICCQIDFFLVKLILFYFHFDFVPGIPLYQHIAQLAGQEEVQMPVPCLNVINGGSHAGNKLAMQEFMILPTGAESFTQAMKMGSEVRIMDIKSLLILSPVLRCITTSRPSSRTSTDWTPQLWGMRVASLPTSRTTRRLLTCWWRP